MASPTRSNPENHSGRSTPHVWAPRTPPTPSKVYNTFWHFACERQHIFNRRLAHDAPPWTHDPILQRHRFTNVYRASDRVSQYLIRRVIYRPDLPACSENLVFRILLFKIFNRIATWDLLEQEFGAITLDRFDMESFAAVLSHARENGHRLYSPAYIMPSTGVLGERIKHRGHLKLLDQMIRSNVAQTFSNASSLSEVYKVLLSHPTIGTFLAFQFAIDINYSPVTNFSEMDFVVAGPGARDGLRKCFVDFGDYSETDVIRWVADRQEEDPPHLGLKFPMLYGRPLQLIDVQNVFCEVSKYARIAHPDVLGLSNRSRIKQVYRVGMPAPRLFYPPKWGINNFIPDDVLALNHNSTLTSSFPLLDN